MIKKFLLSVALLFLPVFVLVPSIGAETDDGPRVDIASDACKVSNANDEVPAICQDIDDASTTNALFGEDGIFTRIISVLSLTVGFIAIVVIVIAGIKMSLSQGDPQKISSSRSQIIYACVGIAVAVLAQIIVQFVLSNV